VNDRDLDNTPPPLRLLHPEVAAPEVEPPGLWTWDDGNPSPFQLGVLTVALCFTGMGVVVLGYALLSALL